ncbi:hypothetical protein [Azospirillum aestuarii]|uniref:hypothetical protein n=1 Tax=Azospirillum aestuarii TaxID=2802052 RepID=UPI004054AFEC
MSELDNALYRAARYNNGAYHPESNPYGHAGKGGTIANWVRSLKDGVTIWNAMAALWNSINFVAERAAVQSIYARCQELVTQITMGSTSALAFPAVDKLLLSTPNVAQVFVYDTRLDDLTADGRRWNEPGRCSHLSYWSEALGTYSGVKRDVPAVLAISGLREQWYFHDALDLDPVTGVPRLWRASNPTGNGLVLCGSTSPITCVFARNGYVYIGSGMGLHIVSLTGDWCDRYDNGGRRRRLGTFAQRNAVLAEGAVSAAVAIHSTQINDVHARVLPGAPLDGAGMPIPTVIVACGSGSSGGVSVIHPNGQVVTIAIAGTYPARCRFVSDSRLMISLGFGDSNVVFGPVPYASVGLGSWYSSTANGSGIAGGTSWANLSAGVTALADAAAAVGNGNGLVLLADNPANPAGSMVAYAAASYATGWQPGDIRLATLCDAATGAITASGELVTNGDFSGGTATGWTPGGATLSIVAGRLRVAATGSGSSTGDATQIVPVVAGRTYVVSCAAARDAAAAGASLIVVDPASGQLLSATTTSTSQVPLSVTITPSGSAITIYQRVSSFAAANWAEFDNVSCQLAAPDRSYKGKGLIVNGTLQRNAVATGADVVAWSDFTPSNHLLQPYNPDLDFPGDFYVGFWVNNTSSWNVLFDRSASAGAFWRCDNIGGAPQIPRFYVGDGTNNAGVVMPYSLQGLGWVAVWFVRRGSSLEAWVNGALVATGSAASVGSLANSTATLTIGNARSLAANANSSIAMFRAGAGAPSPVQFRRMYEDERPLFADGAKCLLGGTSSAVASLDSDPLTGRLAVGTGDGVSVFKGLRRVSYVDEAVLAATTSDTVRSVALRGGSLLIGTAAEVGFVGGAIGGKEAIVVGGPRPVGAGFTARGVTTDATPLDLAPRVLVGERETIMVEARIVGRVVGAADTERLSYFRKATFYRDAGGNVTLQGSVQALGTDTEATSAADATLQIDTSAQSVAARVTGVASKRIAWIASITVTRLSEEAAYAA